MPRPRCNANKIEVISKITISKIVHHEQYDTLDTLLPRFNVDIFTVQPTLDTFTITRCRYDTLNSLQSSLVRWILLRKQQQALRHRILLHPHSHREPWKTFEFRATRCNTINHFYPRQNIEATIPRRGRVFRHPNIDIPLVLFTPPVYISDFQRHCLAFV